MKDGVEVAVELVPICSCRPWEHETERKDFKYAEKIIKTWGNEHFKVVVTGILRPHHNVDDRGFEI